MLALCGYCLLATPFRHCCGRLQLPKPTTIHACSAYTCRTSTHLLHLFLWPCVLRHFACAVPTTLDICPSPNALLVLSIFMQTRDTHLVLCIPLLPHIGDAFVCICWCHDFLHAIPSVVVITVWDCAAVADG